MRYSAMKEIDALVREMVQEGWLFQRGGRHGRLCAPVGRPILTVPSTPSDRRAFMNFRADVRRAFAEIQL